MILSCCSHPYGHNFFMCDMIFFYFICSRATQFAEMLWMGKLRGLKFDLLIDQQIARSHGKVFSLSSREMVSHLMSCEMLAVTLLIRMQIFVHISLSLTHTAADTVQWVLAHERHLCAFR